MNEQQENKPVKTRLYSLDALRGFDMFWITGGTVLVGALAKITNTHWMDSVAEQMEHVPWNGFHFYDLIFPLFMFISGVAIPFAIVSKIQKGTPKKELAIKSFKRMIILIALGIVYNGVLRSGFTTGRYFSVLSQIGIAYFIAAIITIYTRTITARIIWMASIMGLVAILQLFVPVPGIGAGVLTPDGCINGYIDRILMSGDHLYRKVYDPEGTLCIISASAITLLGTLAGYVLKAKKISEKQKVGYLTIGGTALIIIALILSTVYPIIKNCWTSSFVLLTGGISAILMGLFYLIVDVLKWQRWAFYFRVIGMNSIFVYLITRFIYFGGLAQFIFGWSQKSLGDAYHFVNAIGAILIIWLLLYYMYRKNIFLKV